MNAKNKKHTICLFALVSMDLSGDFSIFQSLFRIEKRTVYSPAIIIDRELLFSIQFFVNIGLLICGNQKKNGFMNFLGYIGVIHRIQVNAINALRN